MTPNEQRAVDSLVLKIQMDVLTGSEAIMVLKLVMDAVVERYLATISST